MRELIEKLISMPDLHSRHGVMKRPCPVPDEGGVYAWYFKNVPPMVPVNDCAEYDGMPLLYIGISYGTKGNGKVNKAQTLQGRIQNHFNGNAEGSSLRLTLGCLLKEDLDLELRRVGSGRRMTYGEGEQWLNEWLDLNAYVAWCVCEEPAAVEIELIKRYSIPLNLQGNKGDKFYSVLKAVKKAARDNARMLEILSARF